MSGAKEIRTKIKSIKSTQKITKAMEMVAASKMRKTQDRMRSSRPYAKRILQVIGHLAKGRLEYQHPYLLERPVKRVGFMVISSDRGLCGGLNNNLFKAALKEMKQFWDENIAIDVCALGKKAELFFKRHRANIIASVPHLGDNPNVKSLIGAIKVMLEAYEVGTIDRLFLVYNEFVSTMNQSPRINLLLPILDADREAKEENWDYLYEPDPYSLLNTLLQRYLESLVYQAMVENVACEQAARMIAMKNASESASELIDDFQLVYNKARQAAITRELSEIVAGAAAV